MKSNSELIKFLIKAKISTYASNGEGGERRLEDGSKELTYQEGNFKYRDRYFGSYAFVGEEVVWESGAPVWSMNYHGRIVSDLLSDQVVAEFLKKAMRQVKEERPFRGPEIFKEGYFEYRDKSDGDVSDFIGTEKIYYKGEEVYVLDYHGGFIISR